MLLSYAATIYDESSFLAEAQVVVEIDALMLASLSALIAAIELRGVHAAQPQQR